MRPGRIHGSLSPSLILGMGLAVALAATAAHAARVYRWTDRNGVSHYGDHRPDPDSPRHADGVVEDIQVEAIQVEVEPTAVARLRIQSRGGQYLAWADNQLAGPIEVMLRSGSGPIRSDPALPARATVAAGDSTIVAVFDATAPAELWLDALPGDPSARPRDILYRLPLRQADVRIEQGVDGQFSHTDPENRHAVDFAAAQGTAVLAARDGRVMQVESEFRQAGLNLDRYGGRANFVRIVHDDGTMAIYAHLQAGGVLVRTGQDVVGGQQIGLSGNTGFTTGPHLHFAVQVNRGMRLQSIPFRMSGLAGPAGVAPSGTPSAAPR